MAGDRTGTSTLEKDLNKEMESGETSKVFTLRKSTHGGGSDKNRAFVIDLIIHRGSSSELPLTSHLALPALSPLLGVTQGPSPVCASIFKPR